MKFQVLLAALLCSVNAVLASSKLSFQDLSRLPSPIELDDPAYDDITAQPRDYHLVVLLTALEARYGCELCREFRPEWDVIVNSWNKGDQGDTKLVFGTLDFAQGRNTFQKVFRSAHSTEAYAHRGSLLTCCYSLCSKPHLLPFCSHPPPGPTPNLMGLLSDMTLAGERTHSSSY